VPERLDSIGVTVARRHCFTTVVHGNKLYVFGGRIDTADKMDDSKSLYIGSKSAPGDFIKWTSIQSVSSVDLNPRTRAVAVGNFLFFFVGQNYYFLDLGIYIEFIFEKMF
jgi:hypothetical protein